MAMSEKKKQEIKKAEATNLAMDIERCNNKIRLYENKIEIEKQRLLKLVSKQ